MSDQTKSGTDSVGAVESLRAAAEYVLTTASVAPGSGTGIVSANALRELRAALSRSAEPPVRPPRCLRCGHDENHTTVHGCDFQTGPASSEGTAPCCGCTHYEPELILGGSRSAEGAPWDEPTLKEVAEALGWDISGIKSVEGFVDFFHEQSGAGLPSGAGRAAPSGAAIATAQRVLNPFVEPSISNQLMRDALEAAYAVDFGGSPCSR